MMDQAREICGYCGMYHIGVCPRIKAIDYFDDGSVKRVEFHVFHEANLAQEVGAIDPSQSVGGFVGLGEQMQPRTVYQPPTGGL